MADEKPVGQNLKKCPHGKSHPDLCGFCNQRIANEELHGVPYCQKCGSEPALPSIIGSVTCDECLSKLIYDFHKKNHPIMYKRWMKDLQKVRDGKTERHVSGKIHPLSEYEKKLLEEFELQQT